MQIVICPSESQFPATQSTCQTIQTHKLSKTLEVDDTFLQSIVALCSGGDIVVITLD